MVVLAASSLVSNMNAEASGSMMMLLHAHGSARGLDPDAVLWPWPCSDKQLHVVPEAREHS